MTAENMAKNALIGAFDTRNLEKAGELAKSLRDTLGVIKLGSEFFTAHGPVGVRHVQEVSGLKIFLDLKFNDIPNTVSGAIRSALDLQPFMITIHANGGEAMMQAAVRAVDELYEKGNPSRPLILAVTVLTSLSQEDISLFWPSHTVEDFVKVYAEKAQRCGVDGVVCSAHEIQTIQNACGPDLKLVVPGLRPPWIENDDQKRVMAPHEAIELGADYIVVGRAITTHDDPRWAAKSIIEDIKNPLDQRLSA